ncbi:MAG: 3-hydroxyacyl-ACP dehydratase FabZ [Kiritimatiellia bacterium]
MDVLELNIQQIIEILPHRYPFLLVDRIESCDDKEAIVGIKNVTINEPFFQGHFPGLPVMPGVLQLEAMAQTAGILLNRIAGNPDGVPFFMGIDGARFRRVVKPGDQLRIAINITKLRAKIARFSAVVTVDGEVASEAEMMCMISQGESH